MDKRQVSNQCFWWILSSRIRANGANDTLYQQFCKGYSAATLVHIPEIGPVLRVFEQERAQ